MSAAGTVRLEGIVKRHGALTVLHGIDLAIAAGEFFALLGPSGSGKTTTLRMVAGLEPHDAGRVVQDGVDETTELLSTCPATAHIPIVRLAAGRRLPPRVFAFAR